MSKEVLVTGSSGIIGSLITEHIGERARPFDQAQGHDILDQKSLRESMLGCAAVIHCAWPKEDRYESDNKAKAMGPNALVIAQNVLVAAIDAKVPRVILASSIHADMPEQEPGVPRSPLRHPPEPDSDYGIEKLHVERNGLEAAYKGLDVMCIRFGWVSPNPADSPEAKTEPYPPGEGWLHHDDLRSLVDACLDAPAPQRGRYTLMYGVSIRQPTTAHNTTNPFGWQPQITYTA